MTLTTAQTSSARHPVLFPAEVRLLLLLSRPALTEPQQCIVASLIPQVTNWPALIDTASRKYVLPMVYQNLTALQRNPLPDHALQAMRELSIQATVEMLRRQAAFDWFHTRCVLPTGVEHAYFKGAALAARFYPDPMLRFYRDIDILVPQNQHPSLLRAASAQNCKVCSHIALGDAAVNFNNEKEVFEFLCFTKVPLIVTPQGILVELHSQIDNHTDLFDSKNLLRECSNIVTQKNSHFKTISDTAHFVFICYHHTRHLWSKLNWLADLDAICNSPCFDRAAALNLARSLKIESTVLAALELHDLASSGHHPSEFDHPSPGVDLLSACVDNLAGDLELEKEMRRNQRFGINFSWQDTPIPIWQRYLRMLHMFKPTYQDFCATPGGKTPHWLRYTIAIGIKLKQSSLQRLKEAFGR